MSDSVRPHRRQPARLPRPWDSPGKNTGDGYHFLLQCMKVKSQSEVAQSCPTLSDPMDCSPPGSSVHGTFQARALEWGALPSPRAARYLNIPPSVPSASQKQANKQQKILQLQTWRREWQSIPIFLPGEFRGQRNLGGYKVHGVAESDTT